jgi:hypothetical protein
MPRATGARESEALALIHRLRRWSSGVPTVDVLAVVILALFLGSLVGLALAITRDYGVRPPRLLPDCPSAQAVAERLPVGFRCVTTRSEPPDPDAPVWSPARRGRTDLPCTVTLAAICTLVGPAPRGEVP